MIADGLDLYHVRFVDVNGTRTRYYEAGTGAPLVLVHGGQFGSLYSLDCWSLNLLGLADLFHVYAFDRLGQGYTDNPASDGDYQFDTVMEHARGFRRSLDVPQAHIVGHSRGALVAACLALEQPTQARSLVILDTNTLAPEDPEFPSGAFYADLERRMPAGPPTPETARMEADANSYSRDHVTDDFVERMYAIARLPKTLEAGERMKSLTQGQWTPGLNMRREETLRTIEERGFSVPTLMAWGFNDPSAPLHLGLRLLDLVTPKTTRAELHVFNRAGHYSFREHVEGFNRLLAAFCLGGSTDP